jgi:hypothetical protein
VVEFFPHGLLKRVYARPVFWRHPDSLPGFGVNMAAPAIGHQ